MASPPTLTSSHALLKFLDAYAAAPGADNRFNYSRISNDQALSSLFHSLRFTQIHEPSVSQTDPHYAFRCTSIDEPHLFQFTISLSFHPLLTLDTEDDSDEDFSVEPQLHSFQITILSPFLESSKRSALTKFLLSCTAQLDLLSALHGINSYARLYTKRHAIFSALTEKYGSHSTLSSWPHGTVYTFPSPPPTAAPTVMARSWSFCLQWDVVLHPLEKYPTAEASSHIKGYLLPVNSSSTHCSVTPEQQAYATDFPKTFKSMIKLNGLVKSVDIVHQVLYSRGV